MPDTSFNVAVCQINTKRHWPKAGPRMHKMLRTADRQGATLITLNEISKEQVEVIQARPDWDIFWVVTEKFGKGNWCANAIAWKPAEWKKLRSSGQAVEVPYRRGLKYGPKGPWGKRTLKFANATFESVTNPENVVAIQAFHYPTQFNSNEAGRKKAADASVNWARAHIGKGHNVVLSGDGNNIFPRAKCVTMMYREGPDAQLSSGHYLSASVLPFKKLVLSDHNGLLVKIKFR